MKETMTTTAPKALILIATDGEPVTLVPAPTVEEARKRAITAFTRAIHSGGVLAQFWSRNPGDAARISAARV